MTENRRRLSPEDRREQLLDTARDITEQDGVGACTVDTVAQRAGVTAQLVHKYFGSRSSLLQELFQREDDRYNVEIHARLAEAERFEDVVRVFVTANFDQLSSATAIGQLRAVPEIAALQTRRRRRGGRGAERVLVRALAQEYSVSPEVTEFVLRLGSAASIEASNLAALRPSSHKDRQIEDTVRFILAGIEEVAR